MKKIFSAIISSPLKGRLGGVLFALLATTSLWAHDFAVNGIYYNILTDKTNEVSVTHRGSSYDSYSNEYTDSVTIPSTVSYNGLTYSVTSIGGHAFAYCFGLTSVTIPNSAVTIEGYAFEDCSGLTSITIGNSVTSIGYSAFEGCSSLTSITIPNGVTSIGGYAFYNCSSLTTITIPNSVTSIGGGTFRNCSSLTTITIPNSLTGMGSGVFRGSGLTSVIWNAENCADFRFWAEDRPFYGCDAQVTSFTFGDSVKHIPEYLGLGMGVTSITIPNSVTSIGANVFSNCSNLTSVIWNAENCTDCDTYSDQIPFYGCPITSFTFGDGVKYIPDYLCYKKSNLTYIDIPNSVTSIGKYAFSGCSGLTSVNIGNSVTSIEYGAFISCSGLTSITLPNCVTSIGDCAFYNCSSLTTITIPNNVTTMGENAFSNCSNLTSVIWNAETCDSYYFSSPEYSPFYSCSQITSFTFGDSVKQIPSYLCSGISNLTSITIPNSVTSIGGSAFSGCSNLTSIIWNAENCNEDYWDSESDRPFYGCPHITSFTFGDSVKYIPNYLCSDMSSLISVNIGNNVTTIGSEAFSHCSGLTSITIPNSVTEIRDLTFKNCSSLTSVIWNAENCDDYWGTESYRPFYDCSQITSFTFGDSVKHIPAYLCYDMSSLTSIIIPNSVTNIGYKAFSHCSSLTSVIWNAENCDDYWGSESYRPFYDCSQITSFTFGDSVKHIPAHLCYEMSSLTSVNMGNSVTSIGYKAFSHCSSLNSITIPNSITSIGEKAFLGCSDLASVIWNAENCDDFSWSEIRPFYDCFQITSFTFGDSVKHIPTYLCYEMSTLTSITIPNSVTSIGEGAFYNCSSLDSVVVEAITPPTLGDAGNYSFFSSPTCYIPCGTLSAYQSSAWAEQVGSFVEQCDGPIVDANKCGDNLYWAYTDGTLTITGTGAMYDYWYDAPWWKDLGLNIKTILLPQGVTSIGEYAFWDLPNLTSVVIPEGVTSIGKGAFSVCPALKSIVIPNSVINIGDNAFSSCESLQSINIPNGLTTISRGVFKNCPSLTSVTIPNSVTTIKNSAFYNCSLLATITIPSNMSTIENGAFYGCSSLDSISIEATNPPVLSGSSTFSSSPTCYIPCGTLAAYQSSSWAEQVGSFVEQCNDNENNQSLISVTDGTLSDWDKLPAEYVSSCVHQKGASLAGLKSMKVYADERHINLLVEYKPETITSLEWTNFRIYINTDNSDLTGGYGASWSDANTDILLETAVFASGKPNPYNPAVYKWWGKVGDNSWDGWYDPTIELTQENCWGAIICEGSTPAVGNSQVIGNYIEIQIDYKRIPADWNKNQFTLGVEIDQNWDIAGLLPNASNGELGSTILAEKLLVNVHPINAPILIDGILYEITSNEEPLTAEVYACTDYTIAEVDIPASITHEGQIYDVTSIGNGAFSVCTRLTSITIPNSVMSIGDAAFFACFGLTKVTIPNSVTSIGELAFYNCRSLDSVTLEATTPPTLGGNSFSSSPTCYIPCGTLAAYQSSSWAQQVGSFIEQCDDNNDDQSLISVTDGTLSDWDNLPMEYLFETKCVEGASWDALKSVKVYADLTYINLVVEWDTDIVTDLSSVPFHVYLNVDNDAPTGGWGGLWLEPYNIDVLLEGYFYLDGNPCTYQPDVALYAGTPLADEWAWDWTTIEALAASQLITKGVMEIQIEYGKLPVKLENTFTVGFSILQSWNSVGVLPNAAADEVGNMIPAEKMLVKINNVNAPTSIENTHSPSSITNTQKLLRNGQLIILHDGKTYTVMGAEIK